MRVSRFQLRRDDDVNFVPNQLGREIGQLFGVPVRVSRLDDNVPAVDMSELAKPLPQCLNIGCLVWSANWPENAYPVCLPCLLRPSGERGRRR